MKNNSFQDVGVKLYSIICKEIEFLGVAEHTLEFISET